MIGYLAYTTEQASKIIEYLTAKGNSNYRDLKGYINETVVYFVTNGGAIQCYALRDFIEIYPNHTIRTTVDFDLEEDRTIQLSKDTAKEWYKGNNETLKQLALTVYKPEELSFGYKDITLNSNLTSVNVDIPTHLANKIKTVSKLEVIANYFNGSWKMRPGLTGYFIYKCDTREGYKVKFTATRMVVGTVYFKSETDVEEAIKLLGEDIKYLFD
jgi:hypothetical protein